MFLYKPTITNNDIKPSPLYQLTNSNTKTNLYKLLHKGDILFDIVQKSDYNIQSESFALTYQLDDREVLQSLYVNNKLINETN